MRCEYHKINFDLNRLMIEELPWTQAFYREMPKPESEADGEFHADVKEYFGYPLANQHAMPVYTVQLSSCAQIESTFEQVYAMLVEAVGRLFNESHETLMKYMGCDFLKRNPHFIDYAKWTYRDAGSARQSIYGRFDAAFNPDSEQVTGIYEFNADTPTMLFESVHVQNTVCEQVTGEHELQLNSFYPLLQQTMAEMGAIPGTAAVVFDGGTFEDMATCETLAQIIGEENNCLFVDGRDVSYDNEYPEQPWFVGDQQLSVIFKLIPWEELVEVVPQAWKDWNVWARNVTFLEPAWRWFISNKGIWAYVTHLLDNDDEFHDKHGMLPVLRTYVEPDYFLKNKQSYVKKPKIGRMSNNIEIFGADGKHTFSTDGAYSGEECVYQEYHAPFQVEGRNNFIIGMFMVPDVASNYITLKEATAATLCIREFDSPVLGVRNEKFIPHVIIDDVDRDEDGEFYE
uniref:Glutathionylspermidine synthase n=1 Tax=Pseudomonas phage HRDY3 TaxID=3236930 RepID=A0AB39CDL3_9VIRU